MKRLYRSTKDRMIAGVLGGVAEYLEQDPTIVRMLFVLLAVVTGIVPCILAYIVAVVIMPESGDTSSTL